MPSSQTQANAAKETLLQHRASILRLRGGNDAGVSSLAGERRVDELAENEEISGVLVLLSERETRELREVDAALARIERGTWGLCETCHRPMDGKRLKALPEARTCTTCEV
jgi:RNA polymerase-binding transcription factor DksA